MNLIACVADDMGMIFNNRRVSKDSVVVEKIACLAKNHRLLVNFFSSDLLIPNAIIDENFMIDSGMNDFCFVENISVKAYEEKINALYLFKWNRAYPSDLKMDINLSKYVLESSEEFAGSSHDSVTLEVWEKC